jgi:hypothetical protein
MRSKMLLTAALTLSLALSACGTIYSKSHDWKLPAGLGNYTITAQMDIAFLTRTATILVNGKQVLTGQAWFWSDTIDMDGTVDHFPIHASCSESAKTCDVSIAGFHAATLSF